MANDEAIRTLEAHFWQALIDQDTAKASGMIADDCLITGPSGAMKIGPSRYAAMMEDGNWRLDSFEFSDVSVIHPSKETAIIAYKVRQKGEMKDGPMDLTCADSTTWVRDGDGWKCALHTETILEKA